MFENNDYQTIEGVIRAFNVINKVGVEIPDLTSLFLCTDSLDYYAKSVGNNLNYKDL